MNTLQGLLYANFISEVRYTKWLSNVIFVKKSLEKQRIYVDYANINRAFPEDSFSLPNIDKQVDNFVGNKLLSFGGCIFLL